MLQSPGKSVRKLAQETGLSVYLLIQRLWKSLRTHKITAMRESKQPDHDQRVAYCSCLSDIVTINGVVILDMTLFTDEVWFRHSGYVLYTVDVPSPSILVYRWWLYNRSYGLS
jgi:hypothetical protein